MSAAELLDRLRALDVQLSTQAGRLRVNAPAGALSAELRREIANQKIELLAVLSSNPSVPMRSGADNEPTVLSFAQERLWLAQQLQPQSRAYHLCRAMRVRGRLDTAALKRSLDEIVRRHESLRTKFVVIDGAPCQIIVPPAEIALEAVDLRRLPARQRSNAARRWLEEEAARPFDLESGALLRTRLIRLADHEYLLGLFTHHLAADAWSMGILARELWLCYERCRMDETPKLQVLSCRYRDYALWQRCNLNGEAMKSELDYWRGQLADLPEFSLPGDRPRPAEPTFHGRRISLELSPALTAALNRLSRREKATPFMTLLAALQVLLGRWSGQRDFGIGAPVAERGHRAFENIVGPFLNTLVLRADLSGAPSFRALLGRVRETCLGAYAHQKIPFELLARELAPQQGVQPSRFFRVMLVLQNTPSGHAHPPGLEIESMDVDNHSAQFDLSLYLRERAGRLIGFFEYSSELFDRSTIERMAGQFTALLESIVADADRPIAHLSMLSASEKRRLLVEWNDTKAVYPRQSCIHELFERQAAKTPAALALEDERERVSYRELDRRANRLARELKGLGVGVQSRVAALAERSANTIAAALAIFKAGCVYVPLDPAYPKDRLAFMLADSGAGALITQEKFADWFADAVGATIMLDDLCRDSPSKVASLAEPVAAESPAYILYTSGSTGTPKAVVAPHRGALNRFAWMWRAYPFGAGEKLAQKTSLSFVDSIWEMFGGLLRGVPTVIVADLVAKDPAALADWLERSGATRLVVVPSLLRELLDQPELARRLRALRYCFSSGEALPTDLAARFRALLPDCRLINLYGSSEVAGDVTSYEVTGSERGNFTPLGRPIANSRTYLLDDDLAPVLPGARGEIYVGGDNLAIGYLEPRLTAEKFIPDPFSGIANARLYRTGDLGRYRADGNLEFFGRRDRQLKIRGVRVEPGEIESVLGVHPAVRACLVVRQTMSAPNDRGVTVEDSDSNSVLTAYIVSKSTRPTPPALRAFLKARLPDSMVPSLFVFLDVLPRLPNGKIDVRALPRLRAKSIGGAAREPRNSLEKSIAAVWTEVLAVERPGVDDDFFQLGGHSLSAVKTAAKLRDALNRPISMRDLFDAPTIAGLAKAIETMTQQDLPAIQPSTRNRKLPLSAGQIPLFVMSQLFGGGDFLNLPYAYRLHGRLNSAALGQSVQELIRRHAVLRTGFRDMGSGPKQFIRRSCAVRMAVIDLARRSGAQKELAIEEISKRDAAQSFDIEQPPLARFKLLRLGEVEHILLVTLHHLVGDQWSMGVLHRELAALYQAFSQGKSSPLAELPIQFADFACWQKETLKNGGFAAQIAYWLKQLGEPAPRLEFRRGSKKSPRYHSGRRAVEIDDKLFARTKAFARERNCTPFMIFAAALHILLHRYTDSNDIRIGTLIANRGQPGTDGLIGYFVNAVVLRARIDRCMTFAALIDQVRENCVAAYENQDLPFEHLEALLDKRERRPLYQVMLNYRNQSTPALDVNGLGIASWDGKHRAADPGIGISRLDVNFHLRELSTKLTGTVNYKRDLFDDTAIEELIADYTSILERMISAPDALASEKKIAARRLATL